MPAEWGFSTFCLDSDSEEKCLGFKPLWTTKQENWQLGKIYVSQQAPYKYEES